MPQGEYEEYDHGELPPRIEFYNPQSFWEEEVAPFQEGFYGLYK